MKELYRFREFINESIDYNSWVKPDLDTLKREFRVEHEYKNQNWFKNVDEFIKAVDNAEVVTITPSMDSNIEYRSKTKNYNDRPAYLCRTDSRIGLFSPNGKNVPGDFCAQDEYPGQ